MPNNYFELSSFCNNSIMLWQNDKVYVMDNHLSAAWCWLQSCDPKMKYNFMHIDMHYDLLRCFSIEDLQPLRDNPHMPYKDFLNLNRSRDSGNKTNLFRWDNYIMAAYYLQPDWFHTNIFLTHGEGESDNLQIIEKNPLDMDFWINQYIGEPSESLSGINGDDNELPWIVNLDLDVFYTKDYPYVQLFSDEFIRLIAQILNDNMPNIQVLTIALSPDCLGGRDLMEKWDNSFRILKIMSEKIECLKDFPFPDKPQKWGVIERLIDVVL